MSFSSMYIAATGMVSLGTGMQTISNNLANVETNGFKTMRTNYSDLISKSILGSSPWPTRQVGHGSQVQSIQSMFTQGAFKRSESPLDLALAGDGFFNVRSRLSLNLPKSDEIMYSRAGAFTLDRDGYMEDQSHNILQGWAMSLPRPGETPVRLGSPVDVQITALIMPPRATTAMRQVANLSDDAKPAYDYPAYEVAEILAKDRAELAGQAARGPAETAAWNPAADQRVSAAMDSSGAWFLRASNKAEYNNFFLELARETFGLEVSAGSFSDPAAAIVSGLSLVTPPPDPNRSSGQLTLDEFNFLNGLAQTKMEKYAVEAGQVAYASAYTRTYDTVYRQTISGVPASNLWQLEGNGYAGAWDGRQSPPISPLNYSHAEHQTVYDAAGNAHVLTTYYQKNPHSENVWDYIVTCEPDEDDRLDAAGRPVTDTAQAGLLQKGKITFDANGKIKDLEAQDLNPAATRAGQFGWTADTPNANGYFTVDVKFKNAPAAQSFDLDMGARRTGGVWRLDGVSTTQYGGGSLTVDSRQDGYPQGGLSYLYVTEDGIITGAYSNKQEIPLYQICITRFLNPWGLQKMGNNLFAVTRHSGPGVTTAPGEGGAAVVLGNFLEQSNVDTATEIVNMIMTQRGFQANSKVVTTHDAMISTAIETKR